MQKGGGYGKPVRSSNAEGRGEWVWMASGQWGVDGQWAVRSGNAGRRSGMGMHGH